MAFNAGNAFITISPDMSSFNDEVKAQFAEMGDEAGKAFGDAFSAQLKESFANLPDATIKTDVDTAEATAELDELAKPRTATIKVTTDKSSLEQAKTALSGIGEQGGKLLGNVGTLGAADAAIGLAPQAVGAAVGAAGIGVSLVAAAADAGAFGAIAVPMFTAVTKAQAALTTAQAAYNKATTDAGRATALAAEKAALDGLTPSEKELATQLTAVSAGWKKFSDAEQPVVEGALTPWLQTAASSMGLLSPLVQDGANAIQLLGVDAQQAFQSPFWATFTSTLGQTGEDALTAFGTAAGSVGDGLAHLFVTFAPDIDKLLDDVPTLAGDFDTWAKNVKSGGLEDFFSKTFSHANLSTLDGDLKDVGDFFKNVSSATETLSPAAFSGLSGILTAIGLLPPDAILALTALFLATKTIGAIGNLAGLANNIISLGKAAAGVIGGLFGGAATTAEESTEAATAGTTAGEAGAAAFTTAFTTGVTTSLPTAFLTIGTTVAADGADPAGTVWGTAAATTFAAAFGAEDAIDLTAAFTAIGAAGAVDAGSAGAVMGAAAATGFGTAFAAELGTVLDIGAIAGPVALLAAAVGGGLLGGAVGLGFTTALGAAGIGGAVAGIEGDVKTDAATANTWLQPAGVAAAQGLITGFDSQSGAVTAAAAQAKTWMQTGTAGSNAWLTPAGQQSGQGLGTGFSSAHDFVNSAAAQAKNWIQGALPSPLSILADAGVSVTQGLANGILGEAGAVSSAASYLASLVPATVKDLLGINSPAKVMIPLGSAVPEGIGVGMLGGTGFITSAGSTLATVTANSLGSIASAQSLGALSALGVPSIGAAPRLPGVSSPLSAGQLQLGVTYTGPTGDAVAAIVQGLQFHIQGVNGGDVQGALGQGPVRTS